MPEKKSEELLTLTEVSKRTNISMPTLQRYKKLFQDRIPSVGEGRKQRYPEESLPIFKQIKKENIKKRGRPKKKASEKAQSGGGKKAASGGGKKGAAAQGGAELLTLAEIGRITGISYPTLLRYVKAHLDDIPHVGEGRKRRYKQEAVEVFEKLRSRSGRGRARTAASDGRDPRMAARISQLDRAQREMSRKLDSILAKLDKPIRVTLQR